VGAGRDPAGLPQRVRAGHVSGRIRLDRTLFTATQYPADYGFVDDSLGQDGDPLDALVLVRQPTFPRVPGPLPGRRDVPSDDPRQEHLRDVHHVPEFLRLEIQHFFEVGKDLEPGNSVEGATSVGRTDAEREIRASWDRAGRSHDR
jgi:inorganic pyrophosphatase